jgi:hypothetical protein
MVTEIWIGNAWNSRYLNRRTKKSTATACTNEFTSSLSLVGLVLHMRIGPEWG